MVVYGILEEFLVYAQSFMVCVNKGQCADLILSLILGTIFLFEFYPFPFLLLNKANVFEE